jgi:predicted phosphate transport protein (TIGR00153 family)
MLGWFRAMMPKEERFFDLFEQHAAIVTEGARALQGLLKGGDDIELYVRQISDRENEADEIARQVLTAVRRTFITPFDRSDIQSLAGSLDDAIDQMNKTAKAIMLFEVRNFEPQMQQMGAITLEASLLILEAMPLLRSLGTNAPALSAITEKVVRIEDRADELHDEGRKALYLAGRGGTAPGDAMRFIIGSEIYDHLESVVDRFEDVSKEINSLLVDHL